MPGPILPRVPGNPKNSLTAKTWAPVSYTSTVAGLAAGTTMPFPQVSLQSGFNTPYLVDEIRFTAYTPTAMTSPTVIAGNIAAIVGYQLWTGAYAFSRGGFGQTAYVPMVLYAPTYSGGNGQFENVAQTVNIDTDYRTYSTRRWVLPKPLYMPAGDVIQASVNRNATIGTAIPNITAQITVIGRALPPQAPVPTIRQIPYVGYYIHPSTATYSDANFQLQNPHRSTWHVQRLVANTRNIRGAAGLATGNGFFESPTGVTRYASVKITDSLGYKITGSNQGGFVSLGEIASYLTDAAWTFSRPLPTNENYNVSVQITPGSETNTAFDVMLGFVGYRDE